MKERDLNFVCHHLGHNLNVHSSVYALQTSAVERSKVAAVLTAADRGFLHKLDKKTDSSDVSLDVAMGKSNSIQEYCISQVGFCFN